MILFSDSAQSFFSLNTHSNSASLVNAIQNLPYLDGRTNTQAALTLLRTEQFTPQNGDRPSATNVAIVITDGESTENPGNTIPAAIQARDAGVAIFSIGIGNSINVQELRLISSEPQLEDRNYFLSPTFSSLDNIVLNIVGQTCAVAISELRGYRS